MIQNIYISSPNSKQIYVWKLCNDTEKLELMQIVSTSAHAYPMVIHPNKQFLYVGVRPNFKIDTYHINQEGLLNKINTTKIHASPTYFTINDQGSFLYFASYQYNNVSIIAINNLGILSNSPIQVIENLLGCHSVNIDKNKKLLWVPCLLENNIKLFSIDTNKGTLIPYNPFEIPTNINSGPRHMVFHNSGTHAYIINELNGTINSVLYSSKKIEPIIVQTSKILPDNNITIKNKKFWSSDIHITPDNRWLYCSDRAFNVITCFKILSKTKILKFINYQYTEKQPRSFLIDITGNFLIVLGQKSNYISLYRININTGKLNIISRYKSGIGPIWINILHCKLNNNKVK